LFFQLYGKDLELLGKLAFNRGFYDRAYEFLKAAEWRCTFDKDEETLSSTKAALKGHLPSHCFVLLGIT
jgi:hypothetical protein